MKTKAPTRPPPAAAAPAQKAAACGMTLDDGSSGAVRVDAPVLPGSDAGRLTLALLLSLLLHALLLSFTFSGQGLGLPGFGFPWRERRVEAPDLRIVLVPARVRATEPAGTTVKEPLPQAPTVPTTAGESAPTPAVSPAPPLGPTAEAIVPRAEAAPQAEPDAAIGADPVTAPLRTKGFGEAAPTPIPEPAMIAMERPDEAALFVPVVPAVPTPVIAVAPSASSPEPVNLAPRDAGDVAQVRMETARLEAERQEAERQATARQEAARQEAARQEAARQEAQRIETARQEAARIEAARIEAAKEAEARREAVLRAIGRQLDEEAARREAASTAAGPPSRLAPSSSGGRRGRLLGRTDPNAELIQYAEAWARKIQLNMTFDMVRDAAKRPHTHPLVTVAIRSDGSVESVVFVLSSGVAEIDEAIRRVVQSQGPYPAFPPGLAREFDVIEIRRTWYFDMAIRLY